MKLAIVGGRDFTDTILFNKVIDRLLKREIFINVIEIVSGGAKGIDTLAENYALNHNIKTNIFLPDWDKYGRSAGFKRNVKIISNADITIAFWDGKSKGTKHSMNITKDLDKTLIVVKYNVKENKFKIEKIYFEFISNN